MREGSLQSPKTSRIALAACQDAAVDVTHAHGQAVDEAWVVAATAEVVSEGPFDVRDAVERMDAFCARGPSDSAPAEQMSRRRRFATDGEVYTPMSPARSCEL